VGQVFVGNSHSKIPTVPTFVDSLDSTAERGRRDSPTELEDALGNWTDVPRRCRRYGRRLTKGILRTLILAVSQPGEFLFLVEHEHGLTKLPQLGVEVKSWQRRFL
jgi:hypothetical protein